MDMDLSGDRFLRAAAPMQLLHSFHALFASLLSCSEPFRSIGWWRGNFTPKGRLREGIQMLLDKGLLLLKDLQESFRCIVKKMPAVCHLDRLGRSLPDRFGISWRSISAHNFDFRMTDQPWNKGFGCPVCQKIHDLTPFQIDQDRSIALSLAFCPIVH